MHIIRLEHFLSDRSVDEDIVASMAAYSSLFHFPSPCLSVLIVQLSPAQSAADSSSTSNLSQLVMDFIINTYINFSFYERLIFTFAHPRN